MAAENNWIPMNIACPPFAHYAGDNFFDYVPSLVSLASNPENL